MSTLLALTRGRLIVMGWFSDLFDERAEDTRQGDVARWQDEHAELVGMIGLARDPSRLGDLDDQVPIILKRGEIALAVLGPSSLVEARRGPGRYKGGNQGFSFRVAKGVTYRIGGNRGSFQQGEESLTAIDEGTVTITNKRAVFQGAKQAREWMWSKALGFTDDPTMPLSMIAVSNRQKVSGFTYDEASAAQIRFRLSLAVAMATDTVGDLIEDLTEQLAELDATRPPGAIGDQSELQSSGRSTGGSGEEAFTAPVPSGASAPSAPAGWYVDPTDPSRRRWWDGSAWTTRVSAG